MIGGRGSFQKMIDPSYKLYYWVREPKPFEPAGVSVVIRADQHRSIIADTSGN
jgi:hypothetical protein